MDAEHGDVLPISEARDRLGELVEWEAEGRPTVTLEDLAARYGVDPGDAET
jgi:hypothetical protein